MRSSLPRNEGSIHDPRWDSFNFSFASCRSEASKKSSNDLQNILKVGWLAMAAHAMGFNNSSAFCLECARGCRQARVSCGSDSLISTSYSCLVLGRIDEGVDPESLKASVGTGCVSLAEPVALRQAGWFSCLKRSRYRCHKKTLVLASLWEHSPSANMWHPTVQGGFFLRKRNRINLIIFAKGHILKGASLASRYQSHKWA